MSTRWQGLARAAEGPAYAEAYARRFDEAAVRGEDVHGEASYVAALLDPPARVLDAGCGTGRVAVRLAELGYDVVGVDADRAMLDRAREHAPHLTWLERDLAAGAPETADFDLVLLAGNVVPLLDDGTLVSTAAACADAVRPSGLVVAGFGLDAAHLPDGCPVTGLADWDAACLAAGLGLADRFAAWDVTSRLPAGAVPEGYAVSVHRRGDEAAA